MNYDYVQFFKDKQRSGYWGNEKYSDLWPGTGDLEPLRVQADTFTCTSTATAATPTGGDFRSRCTTARSPAHCARRRRLWLCGG